MKADELEASTEQVSQDAEAILHNERVFKTALHAVEQFFENPLSFAYTSSGSGQKLRQGVKRQVEYMELADGSGPTLVIEVYTKER